MPWWSCRAKEIRPGPDSEPFRIGTRAPEVAGRVFGVFFPGGRGFLGRVPRREGDHEPGVVAGALEDRHPVGAGFGHGRTGPRNSEEWMVRGSDGEKVRHDGHRPGRVRPIRRRPAP